MVLKTETRLAFLLVLMMRWDLSIAFRLSPFLLFSRPLIVAGVEGHHARESARPEFLDDRPVALKMIRAGGLAPADDRRRFPTVYSTKTPVKLNLRTLGR